MRLWGSAWDGQDRAPLRIGIAVVMALSQGLEAYQVSWQAGAQGYPPTGWLSQSLAEVPGAAWISFGLAALGLWGVARDRRVIPSALLALASSLVLSQWQTQIFGSPSRNAFFPGAVLLGWVLGQVWAVNLREAPTRALRERLAEAGALGCLAAAYCGSALSKLLAAGPSWADGAQVRALVLQQAPLLDWPLVASARSLIVHSNTAAIAVSVATLVIEGGAFAVLFGRRLRATWGALLLALHLSITALNTMPYIGASLLVALLCLPWRRPAQTEPLPARVPAPVAVVLVCVIVGAWASSWLGWRAG